MGTHAVHTNGLVSTMSTQASSPYDLLSTMSTHAVRTKNLLSTMSTQASFQ